MKFEMVETLKAEDVDVRLCCETFNVSRSGYYAWKKRPLSARDVANQKLLERITDLHRKSRETYGAPRIYQDLKDEGESCSKNRVAKLMKENSIRSCTVKKFTPQTTDSKHDLPIADRIFKTEDYKTLPTSPNTVWASDITYIPTQEGWVYLAIFLDVFTRKIVGHASSDHMRAELVEEALMMALGQQNFVNDLISHSDRGSQYASELIAKKLAAHKITASMSRKGNCYDNAYAESFFGTLKKELVHRKTFATKREAEQAIFEFIEVWYNRQRRHSSLGFMTPVQYEQHHPAA